MDVQSDIGDDEFVPFLHSLGVETYNKSFEWMLNDPSFAALRWLYNNLDQNNALTAREEYRYIDIEKKGNLLSPEDLESSIATIKHQHPNICLPGEQDAAEDVKSDINMLKEKLSVLEKQEVVVKDLVRQNELIKEELQLEIAQLNAAQQQSTEDTEKAAELCTNLAHEVETITSEVMNVVAESLEAYASCKGDKEKAKRYLTFSPLVTYRQTQALFRSHYHLYISKHLAKQNDITNEHLRMALLEANCMEERLTDAAFAYLESKAELSREQAKLAVVTNYNDVHPSQITSCLLEAQTELELLDQEESIVEQQVQNAVSELVRHRTQIAVHTATAAAVAVRLQIRSTLSHLVTTWRQAYSLDKLLYDSLRHELRTLEDLLQFAQHLKLYVVTDNDAVRSRIESMNQICSEHEQIEEKLKSSNSLLELLYQIIGKPSNEATVLVKIHNDLEIEIKELKETVQDGFRKKENALIEFKKSTSPIHNSIWNGCTKQANCWDRTVASLTHALNNDMEHTDKKVLEASGLFTAVKNGDKHSLRKLWQWFLTDPTKLLAEIKKFRLK